MFSKKYRIKAAEIDQIFKENLKSDNSELFFVKKKTTTAENDRFAILVPKKVCKLAVKRHKNKRKVIQLIKEVREEKKVEFRADVDTYDFIFTLKKDLSDVSDEEIKSILAKILI